MGTAQRRHLEQVAGDGLALAALFAADARIGAGRIDERDDRQAETLGGAHQAQCLAIAFGLGHAVVAAHALLGIAPLLLADDHDGRPSMPRQAADDGQVVAEHAVAMQLGEIRADHVDVVERIGPARMARELRDLPGRQRREDGGGELPALLLQARDLLGDVDLGVGGDMPELLDLRLQFGDGLLEFQKTDGHWPW